MVIVVIRLRNLSNEAHAPHIREFFKGLVIPEGGVQIIGGEDGTAFIIFGSDEDARKAMMLDASYLCDTPVKLTLSSKAEMNKIIEDSQGDPPAAETHNQAGPELPVAADPHAVVAAYDDPYAVVKPRAVYDQQQQPEEEHEKYIEVIFAAGQLFEQDLKAFFSPLVILYVGIHPGPDERYQTAIIKFSSRYEKHEALKKDGSIIGVVPIKISVPAEKYCYVVESYNAQQMPKPKPAVEYPPESRRVWEPTPAPVPAQREYCVEVYGIPSVATYDILGGFFDIPRHCKEQNMFMEMLDGICKGRAYIDFGANGYEYNRCLLRDRALLMGAPVTVRSIPLRDMVEVFRLNRCFFNQVDFDRNESNRKVVDSTFHHLTEYQNRGGSKDFGGQKNKYKGAYQHKPKPATVDPPKVQQQQQKTAAQDNGKTTNESVKPSAEKSPDIKSPDAGSDKKSSSSPSESTAEGSSDDVKNDDEVAKEGDSENNNNTEGGTEAGSGEENDAPNTDSPNAEGAVNAEDASSQNKQDHVRPQQNKRKFCVRLANVPYHASDEDIRNFFKGIPIPANGVHILSKGVKKTGHVFVKFASSEHAHQAEKQHEKDFMGRSVLVKTSYVQYLKTIWERVIGPGFPEDKFNEDPHCSTATAAAVRTKSVIEQFFDKIHHHKMDCVHVRNLPPSTLENDIYSILKREQVRVRRIDVIKDHRGQCKGDAYVELESFDDCFRAVSLHEKVLFFGQPLQFFPISIAQLQKDLDALTAPPKFRDYRGYPGGYPPRPEGKQQPPVDPYMDDKAAFYGAAAVPYSPYEKRPRVDPTPYPEVAAAHPDAAYPPPPVGYRPTASPTDPAAGAPAAVRAEAAPRSPSSEYARKYGYMPPYAGGAPADYRIPVEATAPSSTVKMVNLSFDVTQEDIMEFFAPYSPIPKSVRLVYDGQGRLTGEGVLAFPTPEVAKAAVDKLDGQVFLQRKIKLELD